MANDDREILDGAIVRNAAVVLSLPSAGMLRHHKSRFLAANGDGFFVESIPGESVLIDELIASQQPAGISFKSGTTKIIFASPVQKRETEYRVSDQLVLPALLLRFPLEVKALQRRSNYRVRVATDGDLSLRIWRIGTGAYLKDRPLAAQEIPSKFRDISIGGLGVDFSAPEGQPLRIHSEDRLRIQLIYKTDINLLLEGCMRYPKDSGKEVKLRAGLQFKELGNDIDGRKTLASLTKIVGELQRDEARRYRMGITVGA